MHVYCAVYLLASQGLDGGGLALDGRGLALDGGGFGLDGGGLLTHEEAQPLETGLMNTHTIYPSIRLYHEAEG